VRKFDRSYEVGVEVGVGTVVMIGVGVGYACGWVLLILGDIIGVVVIVDDIISVGAGYARGCISAGVVIVGDGMGVALLCDGIGIAMLGGVAVMMIVGYESGVVFLLSVDFSPMSSILFFPEHVEG
jgi:hypothetical protein